MDHLEDEQRRPRRVPVQRLADPLQGDVRVEGEAREAAPVNLSSYEFPINL